jgi:hypothetical protein
MWRDGARRVRKLIPEALQSVENKLNISLDKLYTKI